VNQEDWYGLGAAALIGLAFYACRRPGTYAAATGLVLAAFAFVSYALWSAERLGDWLLTIVGLAGLAFGFLIVRIMLLRSVSLQLLARLDGSRADPFDEGVAGRLNDMRTYRLVRSTSGGNELTSFGHLVAGVVAGCQRVLRIE
jgi:hypothetical protein